MVAIHGLIRDERLGVYVLGNLDHAEVRHALMWSSSARVSRASRTGRRGIWNWEFGIQNDRTNYKFQIPNSKFRIPNS